jgi:glucosamine--fructose-6-phosphate aminotransferase (isomerizing)
MPDPGELTLDEIRGEASRLDQYPEETSDEFARIFASLRERQLAYVLGNGSSYSASLYLSILLHRRGMPGVPLLASEASFWVPPDASNTAAWIFSQSGSSVDAVQPAQALQRAGSRIIGITNTPDSPLAQLADLPVITNAGPERSVAATKSHWAQLVVSAGLYQYDRRDSWLHSLGAASRGYRTILARPAAIEELAGSTRTSVVFLRSGLRYPLALGARCTAPASH